MKGQQASIDLSFSQNELVISSQDGFDIAEMSNSGFMDGSEYLGKPMLATRSFNWAIPPNTRVSSVSYTINSEVLFPQNLYIYPVQNPEYIGIQEITEFVEPDPTVYLSTLPFPENNILAYDLRGYRVYNYVSITFTPFRYIPASRQLFLILDLTITINYQPISNSYKKETLRPYSYEDVKANENIKAITSVRLK